MTNNIEKLYELASIDKKLDCQRCGAKELKAGKCFEVDCESTYPPFTNTKQLELIKKLAIYDAPLSVDFDERNMFNFSSLYYDGCYNTDFSQALAGLVCELWEDLTPEQREEVRKILQ